MKCVHGMVGACPHCARAVKDRESWRILEQLALEFGVALLILARSVDTSEIDLTKVQSLLKQLRELR